MFPFIILQIDYMKKEIYLLDLNSTLCLKPRPQWNRAQGIVLETEEYRQWLVELLRPKYVALFTVRREIFKTGTLNNIRVKTGWQPQDAIFRYFDDPPGSKAHLAKDKMLVERIFRKYRPARHRFFALESNTATHGMLKKYDIPFAKIYPGEIWDQLPFDDEQLSIPGTDQPDEVV